MLLHGGGFGRLAGRPLAGWLASGRAGLQRLGFAVEVSQMNGRLPFANLPIVARLSPLSVTSQSGTFALSIGTDGYFKLSPSAGQAV